MTTSKSKTYDYNKYDDVNKADYKLNKVQKALNSLTSIVLGVSLKYIDQASQASHAPRPETINLEMR